MKRCVMGSYQFHNVQQQRHARDTVKMKVNILHPVMTYTVQRITDPEFYFQNLVMDLQGFKYWHVLWTDSESVVSVAEIPKQQIANG